MKPKSPESSGQYDLFRTRLTDLLDLRHELYRLADLIDWRILDQELGQYFMTDTGAPALPIRLIAELHYLKHSFAHSDEEVVARWVENPYWQYFCGEEFFQHEFFQAGVDSKTVKPSHFKSVTVDSMVQEIAITYPTDGKLVERCRQYLVRLVYRHGLSLRQNYNRKAPFLLLMANRYQHARQLQRKRKALKQIKTLVGRVVRDIERQLPTQTVEVQSDFQETLHKTRRILSQQVHDKNKLYSFNAPVVECIGKGKAHQKYEFGVTVTNRSHFVLGARSFPANPYDGHTLHSCLEQTEILSGVNAEEAFVDLGYRGVEIPGVNIHLKNEGLLRRNYFKGALGDALHAVLCGTGHNIRLILKQLRIFWPELWQGLHRFGALSQSGLVLLLT